MKRLRSPRKVRFLARVWVVAPPVGKCCGRISLRLALMNPEDHAQRSGKIRGMSDECGNASCREETGIGVKRKRRTEVHEVHSASPTSAKADIGVERAEGCAR